MDIENPENFNNQPEKGKTETMSMPEIIINLEKGTHLLSVALKGNNSEWGNCDSELAKLTEQHFKEHPINTDIKTAIEELTEEGIDEESLYNLSLTYQHPERTGYVFDMLEKYKDVDKTRAKKSQRTLIEALGILDKDPSLDNLKKKFIEETKKDIAIRQEQLEESRQRIEKLINFFQPKSKTIEIEKVNLMPTDFLCPKRSGRSFTFGKELILMSSPKDSLDGQSHEFLHGIINPIVDKLEKNLTEEQKSRIIELASGKIKQHYGEEKYYSHLCEGFIRTYLNIFEKGEKPLTYEKFLELVCQKNLNNEQFQKILAGEKETKQRCDTLGISNLKEFNKKSKNYFEIYEKDELGNIIYNFFQDYKNTSLNQSKLNFEDYLLQNFTQHLDKAK